MPLRARKPRRIIPTTLSDAIDGSQAPAGAMALLTNLIPQPNSRGVFVPRPAMAPRATIPGAAGQATALQASGDDFFGMAPNAAFPGKDAPFFYESDTNSFVTIAGLSSALLPATQPATGAWTPPTIAPVAGRVIFTHPGFPGGTTNPLLFLQFLVNTTSGSPTLSAPFVGYSPPIPVGSSITVEAVTATIESVVSSQVSTVADGSTGNNFITVNSATGIYVGQQVSGPGFSQIVTAVAGTQITINGLLTETFFQQTVTFYGSIITMSAGASATAMGTLATVWSGQPAIKFGWLDLSNFSAQIVANAGQNEFVLSGSPLLAGIQPGMTISGPNIPASTVVQQANYVNFQLFCGTTAGSPILNIFAGFSASAIAVGQAVSGPGILPGTTVVGYNLSNYEILISTAATATNPSASTPAVTLTFSGAIIVMSQPATGNGAQETVTIAGGTPTAPLWGAGDLNINPIAGTGPPIFVAAFNGRAWYGVDTGDQQSVQASDAGDPTTQTFISQTLSLDTRAPLIAVGGGDLSTLLGGMVAGLFIFQGDQAITQITGDFSTNNISTQNLPVAASTFAPNSIVNTPRGLMFVATDGVRMITQSGAITDPIGASGAGMLLPFLCASVPSRIAAAYNENVYRITIAWQPPQSAEQVWGGAPRTDEFWLHLPPLGQPLEKAAWSGPHASTAALISPLSEFSSFLLAPLAEPSNLYRSDPFPTAESVYVELGSAIQCAMQTLLMPDNPEAYANMIVETTVWLGIQSGQGNVLVTATDDLGETLNQAYVWIGPQSLPAHRAILWGEPLIFRQVVLGFAAQASPYLQLGPIAIREQPLGYQLPYPVPEIAISDVSILDGGDVAA